MKHLFLGLLFFSLFVSTPSDTTNYPCTATPQSFLKPRGDNLSKKLQSKSTNGNFRSRHQTLTTNFILNTAPKRLMFRTGKMRHKVANEGLVNVSVKPPTNDTPSKGGSVVSVSISKTIIERLQGQPISTHVGTIPLNEMDVVYAQEAGSASPNLYIFGDDKDGYVLYESAASIEAIATVPRIDSNHQGKRMNFCRYPSTVYYNGYWYQFATDESTYRQPFGTAGVDLFKARFHPHNIAFAPRTPLTTACGSDNQQFYYDQHVSYNPHKNEYVWVYNTKPYEQPGYGVPIVRSRIRTAPTPEGPWTDVSGNVLSYIDDDPTNQINLIDLIILSQYDPHLLFGRDGKSYGTCGIIASLPNGDDVFGALIIEIDPQTYKSILGTMKTIWTTSDARFKSNWSPQYCPFSFNAYQFQEPGYYEIADKDYILLPHNGGDENSPAGGLHYMALAPHSMGSALPIIFQPDPKADWYFNFGITPVGNSFVSLTGLPLNAPVTCACHSPLKIKIAPVQSGGGLVMNQDRYVQIETALRSNKYQLEVQFSAGAGRTEALFGNYPFVNDAYPVGSQVSLLEDGRVVLIHETNASASWDNAVPSTMFSSPITIKIVNDGTNVELFVNGVSKGKRTSPTGNIHLSTIGCSSTAGNVNYQYPSADNLFLGTIYYAKLKDLALGSDF